ncbi:DNA-binding protein WhiA [Parablautia intestinalis]|uniref:Probable cell division protein WhiA n=1 Tax=Parablautia intestinalis TaxID=2320100 RepID=A0A3A9AUH5_9FIRM|nr:DNA-binding protein WhiA [Parablautia intestinalis]RKI90866.1 DNA-binding protein WhiA [Parablautia intestinalis]
MSFSSDVKEELEKVVPEPRHCQLAELAALIHFGCRIERTGTGIEENAKTGLHKPEDFAICPENPFAARKYFTLLRKTFIINNAVKVLQAVKILDEAGQIHELSEQVNPLLLKNSCCRRAFLRGVFLCIGSMSDPKKGYHLEFVCEHEPQAQQIRQIISGFEIEAKIVRRKKYFVVYLKEGAGIVDLLNVTGAHISLMQLESLRVEKEVRNSINRKVNCEAANITKTVYAASKQIEDILFLQKNYGLSNLPDNLRQMAEVRLEYPDNSLQELGKYLNPPVGKSGVNHRLRKLSDMAEKIRG